MQQVGDEPGPPHIGSMRISAPGLSFHDERLTGHAPSDSGWFISATDADADNQSYVVRDRRITPAQALAIAAGFDAVLTENTGQPVDVFTRGVEGQNRYARDSAESAAKLAVTLAEQARVRAEALATWDMPDPEPTPSVTA